MSCIPLVIGGESLKSLEYKHGDILEVKSEDLKQGDIFNSKS